MLDRLGQELDLLRGQLAAVRATRADGDEVSEEVPAEGGAHALPADGGADS